jgi:signal transduction histidine kinase
MDSYTKDLSDAVEDRTRALDAARKEADLANKNKSKFLANMSHELRTPLNAIKGISDLLEFGSFAARRPLIRKMEELKKYTEAEADPDSTIENAISAILGCLKDKQALEELPFIQLQAALAERPDSTVYLAWLSEMRALVQKERSETRNAHSRIRISSNFLLELINKALDLAKIEAGRIEVRKESVPLAPLLQEVLEYGENYAAAKDKTSLVISSLVADGAPEEGFFDPTLTKQVLLNLVSNAIKYSQKGTIQISVAKERNSITFSVSDQGMGIREEEKSLIFSEFGRTKEGLNIEGTGLGLALSKQLIEKQSGHIGFESKFGSGSTFWFTLSLKKHTQRKK